MIKNSKFSIPPMLNELLKKVVKYVINLYNSLGITCVFVVCIIIDFRIVLVEQEKNVGHWVCFLKYKNIIESFNSYGKDIDKQKDTFGKIKNTILGQHTDYLTHLVKKSKYKYVINKTPFQSAEEGINTCGRWCILRIIAMKDLFMDLEAFKKMIIKGCDDLKVEPDALVSIWIN